MSRWSSPLKLFIDLEQDPDPGPEGAVGGNTGNWDPEEPLLTLATLPTARRTLPLTSAPQSPPLERTPLLSTTTQGREFRGGSNANIAESVLDSPRPRVTYPYTQGAYTQGATGTTATAMERSLLEASPSFLGWRCEEMMQSAPTKTEKSTHSALHIAGEYLPRKRPGVEPGSLYARVWSQQPRTEHTTSAQQPESGHTLLPTRTSPEQPYIKQGSPRMRVSSQQYQASDEYSVSRGQVSQHETGGYGLLPTRTAYRQTITGHGCPRTTVSQVSPQIVVSPHVYATERRRLTSATPQYPGATCGGQEPLPYSQLSPPFRAPSAEQLTAQYTQPPRRSDTPAVWRSDTPAVRRSDTATPQYPGATCGGQEPLPYSQLSPPFRAPSAEQLTVPYTQPPRRSDTPAVWRSDTPAVWRSDTPAVWRSDTLAVWRSDTPAVWRSTTQSTWSTQLELDLPSVPKVTPPIDVLCGLMKMRAMRALQEVGTTKTMDVFQDITCNFCKRNGERKTFYKSHKLMDRNGKIVCPILRKYVCPLCGATGDDAHTVSYCPLGRGESMVATSRTPRKSCGCSRDCKHGRTKKH